MKSDGSYDSFLFYPRNAGVKRQRYQYLALDQYFNFQPIYKHKRFTNISKLIRELISKNKKIAPKIGNTRSYCK